MTAKRRPSDMIKAIYFPITEQAIMAQIDHHRGFIEEIRHCLRVGLRLGGSISREIRQAEQAIASCQKRLMLG